MYGSAVTVNGGAKVDMLNCSVIACKSRTGSIHNIYGELNIVNSEITFGDVYQYYERNGGALTANRVTRAVNSIPYYWYFWRGFDGNIFLRDKILPFA